MTYTPEQLDKMRDWVALNVMGYRPNLKSYFGSLGFIVTKEDFKPDEDANQMLMALDTFDDWAIAKIQPAGDYGCQIGDSSSELRARNKSLGLAALIAMCRASGMPLTGEDDD